MGHVPNADLTHGEQLVLRLHPHAKIMVRPALVLLLIVAAAITIMLVLPPSVAGHGTIRLIVGLVALLAAVIWFGTPFLRWRTTIYEVTTRRLRLREGIISRSGRDIPLRPVGRRVARRDGPAGGDRDPRCAARASGPVPAGGRRGGHAGPGRTG